MKKILIALSLSFAVSSAQVQAADCSGLPSWSTLKTALTKARQEANGGLNLDMWGTLVNRDGEVCAVTFTGKDRGSQWPGSRVISAQKANTANAFSLTESALSTANIYSGAQPGGFLFGIEMSNLLNTELSAKGKSADYGQEKDPMVGGKIGGVIVFGGGLALYNKEGKLVGALGVSGDTSCADHNIAWKTRKGLALDYVPAGVSPEKDDNIIYLKSGEAANGFKHPGCLGPEAKVSLPPVAKK